MSDVFRLPRGVALSTIFFAPEDARDHEREDADCPDSTRLPPVTWLPSHAREPEGDDLDSRGF